MTELATLGRPDVQFRFSGHESFACRYAWLPKAFRAISNDPSIFYNEEDAMVEMGIGKNMVRSLKFWVEAMGVARATGNKAHQLTDFGQAVFGAEGVDKYLEDARTLWLLHWNVSAQVTPPIFAWHFLLSEWPYPEFTRSEALSAFIRQSAKLGYSHSEVTLAQHLDVFMHTYYNGKTAKVGVEDSLDGPLVDLNLLTTVGERKAEGGRWETVFAFRREAKPEITDALFEHCVLDFWNRNLPEEKTISLRAVATSPCSPGQVFKLSEDDVRTRLEEMSRREAGCIVYQPSAVQGLLTRRNPKAASSVAMIYGAR